MPPVPTDAATPQHCPSQRELDDLELLLNGVLAPTTGFNEPGSSVTLTLPPEVEAESRDAGVVELVDPEGLPLARAPWPSGAVKHLASPEHGPFRRLYLSPAQVREQYAGRTVVPVRQPLTERQLAGLHDAGAVVLLALVGARTPSPSGPALLRASLAAAELLPDAVVAAAPVALRDAPGETEAFLESVVAAYAGPAPVRSPEPTTTGADPYPESVAATLGADNPTGAVLFFTGLSGSGKSTLARALMDLVLEQTSRTVTSLDGDVVRRHLSKGLTFSREDRETNILRIGWVAAEIARHGGLAVCSPIAPFDETRQRVRSMVEEAGGRFFLVHVATPLEECERRDRKGLYAKARAGEIPDFTGISSPYEEPDDADVVVDTTGRSIDDALGDVLTGLGPVVPELTPLAGRVAAEERGGVSRPPEPPLNILFVCTANICRSPYMEAVTRARLAGRDVEVASAGIYGLDAHPADEAMAAQLRDRGIEAPDFRSRAMTRELIDEADVVLTAEAAHRSFLLEEHPAAFRKVFTLGQLASYVTHHDTAAHGRELVAEASRARGNASPDLDVADPYRRGGAAAAATARRIDDLLAVVLPALVSDRAPDKDPDKDPGKN